MITAAYSASKDVAEELLSYFVDIGNKECFGAMLYMCFDLLSADFVEELSWQHSLNDFYMPYRIQVQRALVAKVEALEKKVQELSVKESKKEQAEADAPIINPGGFGNRLMLTAGNGYAPQGPPPMMMNGTGVPTGIPSVSNNPHPP
jgi:clathrin heavy chain